MHNTDLGKEIHDWAIQCGFDDCGIISVDEMDGFEELYQKRISDVPQSNYFYDGVGDLRGTKERFPWARSIVILTFNYENTAIRGNCRGNMQKHFFWNRMETVTRVMI